MDIVSRTPFTLKLIQRFPGYKESVGSKFSMNERDIWENGFYTLAAEENETLEVLFDSADKNARLYLEALDVMPYDDKNLFEDEEGRVISYRITRKLFIMFQRQHNRYIKS